MQEENDELYELLKHSETGKLKDEVCGLRRAVAKLEDALNGVPPFPETRSSFAEKASYSFRQNLTKLSTLYRTFLCLPDMVHDGR